MTATLEQLGLRFDYPEDWSLDAADDSESLQQVVVSSPHTAFFQVSKHPRDAELEYLFDEALAALRNEYSEIEVDLANETIEQQLVPGYSVNFFCHGLTSTCWLKGLATSEHTFLLLCQAEDREFDRLSDVFHAMLASAVRNAAGS